MKSETNWSVAVPWVLSAVAVIVGVWQFATQQAQANRRPFLEKQLELAFKATETAATLASTSDRDEWEKARANFWHLYWGPLSIVEDREVEARMVDLGQLVPVKPAPDVQLPMEALQVASYRLAHAVRNLVLKSWKIDLPELQSGRTRE